MVRFGTFEFDAERHVLTADGQPVHLTPKAFLLLKLLIDSAPRVVSKRNIHDHLWPNGVVADATLVGLVKELRRALRDDTPDAPIIRTVQRVGYAFNARLEEAARVERETVPAVASVSSPAMTSVPMPRGRWYVGVAFGLLLSAVIFSVLPRAARDVGASTANTVNTAGALPSFPASGEKAVAVLPFANLSGDPAQQYFVDGIAEELLIALARLPDLQVTGRVSAGYFRGRNDSLRVIAEALGVAHLVTGSVRKAGDRVRVAVELVDATTGYQLWADRYDSHLGDIFALQDEIATGVAKALQVTLGLGENSEIGMTRNVAAFDEFLRGVAAFGESQPASFVRASEHMQRAIAIDRGFSRAWSYLFCIYLELASVTAQAEEWNRRAVEALEQARALTPDAPFVRILDVRNHIIQGNRLEARAALDAMPAGYWTLDRYLTRDVFEGRFLISTGDAHDAVRVLERARAAEPLSSVVALYLATAYGAAGNLTAALAESDRGIALAQSSPTHLGNAMLMALGTRDEDLIRSRVVAAIASAPAEFRDVNLALLEHLGDPSGGRAALRRFEDEPAARNSIFETTLAHWAAYYGAPESALERLAAVAPGSIDEALLWRPVLSEARRLPGFKDLVREAGLVDYWRAHGWSDFCQPLAGGDDFECR